MEPTFNPTPLIMIGIFLVSLLVGWGIGFADSNRRTEIKIKQAEEKSAKAVKQAENKVAQIQERVKELESAPPPAPPAPALPGTTLMRLWVDSQQQPRLDLDGQTASTAPMSDHDRKRLIALLTVMRPWIEGKPAPAAPIPALAPRPVEAPASLPQAAPVAPVTAPPRPAASTVAPVSPIPFLSAAKPVEKPKAPLSMVEQIDEILQAKLAASPLADRGIKLIESPEGGVIVVVGTQKFQGVGEVTDPQIQSILRASIAEWEKKFTPGL